MSEVVNDPVETISGTIKNFNTDDELAEIERCLKAITGEKKYPTSLKAGKAHNLVIEMKGVHGKGNQVQEFRKSFLESVEWSQVPQITNNDPAAYSEKTILTLEFNVQGIIYND